MSFIPSDQNAILDLCPSPDTFTKKTWEIDHSRVEHGVNLG